MKGLFSPIVALWNYFKDMNSESGGKGVSIKRNIAWGTGSLLVFVEIYSLMQLPRVSYQDIVVYISLAKFYAVLDASLILLVLGITSLEKITDLIQRIKGGVIVNEAPKDNNNPPA